MPANIDDLILTKIDQPLIVHAEKGWVSQMKDRPNYAIVLCSRGQIVYMLDGKEYLSHPGNAILLPKGRSYSLLTLESGIFPILNFDCQNWVCSDILTIPLDDPKACLQDCAALRNLMFRQGSKLKTHSIFYELLSKVFPKQASGQNPLQPLLQYIDEHLSDPELSNIQLASVLQISEVYLRKLFSTHLHTSPKQYILELRLRKAKQLLMDTPFSVSSIAEECGFSGVYHFSRAFKQQTGQSPTEFIAQNKTFQI